jgi:hypothetical protein
LAAAKLVKQTGATVAGSLVLLEIAELLGSEKLSKEKILSKALIQI